MINNNCGFGFNDKNILRPRIHQVIQVTYQPVKAYHIAVERHPEAILNRYVRAGSNSTLIIPKVDQFLQTYSSPVGVNSATHLKPGWSAVRSKSINMVEPINTIPHSSTAIDFR
jgi:hypothetical protein